LGGVAEAPVSVLVFEHGAHGVPGAVVVEPPGLPVAGRGRRGPGGSAPWLRIQNTKST
jgi:hypothetical protein